MDSYAFYQIDVFTDVPYRGNPAAVFPDATGLTSQQMQQIARELNLSETAFVSPSDQATRRVRFFTPATEIALSGHPTLATWFVLGVTGALDLPPDGVVDVTQEIGAGILPVSLHTESGRITKVVMTQAAPEFGEPLDELAAERLEQILGVPPGEIAAADIKPQVVSTGVRQLMVPVNNMASLSSAQPHETALAHFLTQYRTDTVMCFSLESVHPAHAAHCRVFAPMLGVPEDPVSGSAAGSLGAYLVKNRVYRPADGNRVRLLLEQGLEVGRDGRIDVEVLTDEIGTPETVRVGGACVLVLDGRLRVLPS